MRTIYIMTEEEHEDWYSDDAQFSDKAREAIWQTAHDKGCSEIWDADGIVVDANPN